MKDCNKSDLIRPLVLLTFIGKTASLISKNFADSAPFTMAKPKMDSGIGRSSKMVAAKKLRAQNQEPK